MIYFLSKLFTYTILPPSLFIWGLVIASFKKIKYLSLSLAILFWFLSTQFGANLLLYPLENWHFESVTISPKYVVVLGGGFDKGDLATSSGATERIIKGLALANQNHIPFVYSGCEAEYAKKTIDYIQQGFGTHITTLFEGKSLDTYQNAKFTANLLQDKTVYLVTSAYHLPRAYKLFRHFGFTIVPIKTDFKTNNQYTIWSIFPQMDNFRNSYLAIHEYVGLLSLLLRKIS